MFAQPTQTEINAHVAQVAATVGDGFIVSPNRWGFHARCKGCGGGFTETGGATVGRVIEHGSKCV